MICILLTFYSATKIINSILVILQILINASTHIKKERFNLQRVEDHSNLYTMRRAIIKKMLYIGRSTSSQALEGDF